MALGKKSHRCEITAAQWAFYLSPTHTLEMRVLHSRHQFDRRNERKIVKHPSIGEENIGSPSTRKDIALATRSKNGRESAGSEGSLNKIEARTLADQFTPQQKRCFVLQICGGCKESDV